MSLYFIKRSRLQILFTLKSVMVNSINEKKRYNEQKLFLPSAMMLQEFPSYLRKFSFQNMHFSKPHC